MSSVCVWVMTPGRLGLKVKVIGQSQVLGLLTDGRNSTFQCYVISCALARRGARLGAAEATGSTGVQHMWAW